MTNSVYCLDASTGAKLWSFLIGEIVLSSPAVADGRVYVGRNYGYPFFCLNASTGEFLWVYPLTNANNSVWSSPAVADGKVYVGSLSNVNSVYCLDAADGTSVWNYTAGSGVLSSPAVVGGRVYVGSGDHSVYCLDAATGAFVWSYTTGDSVNSSPAVVGGMVYVGSDDGNVYCQEAADGALIWNYTTGDTVDSSPAVVNGVVYVGSCDGNIYAFGPSSGPQTYSVSFSESGLPSGASWTVTLEVPFVFDIQSTYAPSQITFSVPNGVYSFSVASNGYSASPMSGSVVVNGAGETELITFSTTYATQIPWNIQEDEYSQQYPNLARYCYGYASTSVLYFMHYKMDNNNFPFFPSQTPMAQHTSDLDISGLSSEPYKGSLNNASLALVFHSFAQPDVYNYHDQGRQYGYMLGNLTANQPVVLDLYHSGDSNALSHAVVAYGVGPPPDPHVPGDVTIYIYDPNKPQQSCNITYNLVTNSFSYRGIDRFTVISPNEMLIDFPPAGPLKWTFFEGYCIVGVNCHSKMAMLQDDDFKQDYFNELGNSQTFVRGIPDSSGIMEGECQVYAVPRKTIFSIFDPGSEQSTILISRADNESGQLVGYGYFVNATTTQGSLNFIITPSDSGLSINAGDNAVNASVTTFYATEQSCCVFQSSNVQIAAMETANFTVPYVTSAVPYKDVVGQNCTLPINVTITNKGDIPENLNLTVCANATTIATETIIGLSNGTSTTLTLNWNTSNFAYGNYIISAYTQLFPNQTEATNSNCTCGLTTVSIIGDITGSDGWPDGKVDMRDVGLVARSFGQTVPPAPSNCDLTSPTAGVPDGKIDMRDIGLVARHFGDHA